MSLPEITLPYGTPGFLAADHGVDERDVYAPVPNTTGHSRSRRVRTIAPRVVTVSLRLSQAQMTALDSWFEGPLKVGEREFSAEVANQGPGLVTVWWRASWVGPYTAEPKAGGFWNVSGSLLLTGDASTTGPPRTSMSLSLRAPIAMEA